MTDGPAPAPDVASPPRLSRRNFLGALAALTVGGGIVPLVEAKNCRVLRLDIPVPRLPAAFDGLRVAFLADTHHSAWVPLGYLEAVVEMTNALRPDLVLLGGDYVHRDWDYRKRLSLPYVRPGIGVFNGLRAPLGRFAVLGNHDNWNGHRDQVRAALAENGIPELLNAGVWLQRPGGARLRLAGVADLGTGRPDVAAALGDAGAGDATLLLQHNPDFMETLRDPRVSLVLAGHTHGGQIVLPFVGALRVPSNYGQKYLHGLVRGPSGVSVFVTRGVGTIGPPVRFNCPPEVALLTLRKMTNDQ